MPKTFAKPDLHRTHTPGVMKSSSLSRIFLIFSMLSVLAAGAAIWVMQPAVAYAQSADAASPNYEGLRKSLEKSLGVEKVDEVSKTPYAGMLEVRVGTDIFYSDPSGTYLFAGNVIDLRSNENLTQTRTNKLTSIAWKDLPLNDAIKIVRGKGTRQVAMFEDPNCGYCRLIHQHFTKVDDVTIYVFLLPILSDDSGTKAKQIWCSADRSKAWLDWMLDKKLPTGDGACANPNERVTAMGRKYKITGTPTIVFTDGQRVPGAIPPEQIEKRLASAKS